MNNGTWDGMANMGERCSGPWAVNWVVNGGGGRMSNDIKGTGRTRAAPFFHWLLLMRASLFLRMTRSGNGSIDPFGRIRTREASVWYGRDRAEWDRLVGLDTFPFSGLTCG